MKLRTVFPCFGQQARALPRLKCAVWSLHESVAVEMVCLNSVVAKGVCCDSDFPCCVLFVLPLVSLPSFALQFCILF